MDKKNILSGCFPWVVLFITVLLTEGCGEWSGIEIKPGALEKAEFIFQSAPFSSCHASTIAETRGGLMAAWFGGTQEGHPDVGIWLARYDGRIWSSPVEIANGVQEDGKQRFACWNPVLFQSEGGPLLLFYKVGPSPSRW